MAPEKPRDSSDTHEFYYGVAGIIFLQGTSTAACIKRHPTAETKAKPGDGMSHARVLLAFVHVDVFSLKAVQSGGEMTNGRRNRARKRSPGSLVTQKFTRNSLAAICLPAVDSFNGSYHSCSSIIRWGCQLGCIRYADKGGSLLPWLALRAALTAPLVPPPPPPSPDVAPDAAPVLLEAF